MKQHTFIKSTLKCFARDFISEFTQTIQKRIAANEKEQEKLNDDVNYK